MRLPFALVLLVEEPLQHVSRAVVFVTTPQTSIVVSFTITTPYCGTALYYLAEETNKHASRGRRPGLSHEHLCWKPNPL
jgi:hypothetical protein